MTGGCDSSMLRRRAGVCAPVPHGVGCSSRDVPPLLGEYIPTRVEAVRLRTERVLLGGVSSFDLRLRCDGSLVSRTGVGGDEDSVEAGIRSNFRRGMGRRMGGPSFIVEAIAAQGFTGDSECLDSCGQRCLAFVYWRPARLAADKRSRHQLTSQRNVAQPKQISCRRCRKKIDSKHISEGKDG